MVEPIGHDRIREQLHSLARKRFAGDDAALPHAWLFAGPAGVGKFAVARWWAALLKCPQQGACGLACESCRLVAAGVHPDVFESGPPPKDKNALQSADVEIERKSSVGIAESRALVQRLSLRPVHAGPRVAIMREASLMTIEAQNALLKLLEEPPGSAVIILVTDNVGAMLQTVRSRCRHLTFGTLTDDEVQRVLVRLGRSDDEATAAAACAHGSVARALELDAEGLADREQILLAYEAAREDPLAIDSLVQALVERKESGYALPDILEWQIAKIETALGRRSAEPSPLLARVLDATGPEGARDDSRIETNRDIHDIHEWIEEAERIRQTMDALSRNANARLVIRDMLMNMRASADR
jgi:DNA polymerase III subunit delta'